MAVSAWQDTLAEIKLKNALEKMMISRNNNIPALLIQSIDLKQISALNNLGLNLPPGDGEIDLMMAYLSGDVLHVNLYEVKRRQSYPWLLTPRRPNKKTVKGAVEKAENQLNKDLEVLMAILADIPPKLSSAPWPASPKHPSLSLRQFFALIALRMEWSARKTWKSCPSCRRRPRCQTSLTQPRLMERTICLPSSPDASLTKVFSTSVTERL